MRLVNKVIPHEELMSEVRKIARKLTQKPKVALMMAKSAIDKGCEIDLANARAMEIQACALCFSTQDIEEGVAAFLEKREPRFIGR